MSSSSACRMAETLRSARALGLYAALAILIVDHGANIAHHLSSAAQDRTAFVWSLAWWPFAVAHGLDPLYTHFVWQPVGVSLLWVTAVPLLGLLLSPLTLTAGPVFAYNVAIIAAPALSAWAFYHLGRRCGAAEAPALIGGYIYGFSTYVLQQDNAALNLSLVPLPPLMILLAIERVAGRLPSRTFSLGLAALLAAQCLLSLEIAAFCVVFGALAWVLALFYLPAWRPGLRRLLPDGLIAGVVLAMVLSPLLWQMFETRGAMRLPIVWRYYFVTDLENIAVPSGANMWGRLTGWAMAPRGANEEDGYLGAPLLLMLAMMLPAARREAHMRYLFVLFACFLVASLGPLLWCGGRPTSILMPWFPFSALPILGDAVPARFALFVSLAAALIAVLFMGRPGRWRLALGVLAGRAMLPRPHVWGGIPDDPFFAPGRVQAVLGVNPQLLILPFSINGPSSYWQVESRFAFTQTGGYLGFPPAAMQDYPAVSALFGNHTGPGFAGDFARFAIATGTQFVVETRATTPSMAAAVATLGWPARRVDDVTILTVPHG